MTIVNCATTEGYFHVSYADALGGNSVRISLGQATTISQLKGMAECSHSDAAMQVESRRFAETLDSSGVSFSTNHSAGARDVAQSPPADYSSDPESTEVGRRARRFGLPVGPRRPLRFSVRRRPVPSDESGAEQRRPEGHHDRASGRRIKRQTTGRRLGAILRRSTPHLSLRPYRSSDARPKFTRGDGSSEGFNALRRSRSSDDALPGSLGRVEFRKGSVPQTDVDVDVDVDAGGDRSVSGPLSPSGRYARAWGNASGHDDDEVDGDWCNGGDDSGQHHSAAAAEHSENPRSKSRLRSEHPRRLIFSARPKPDGYLSAPGAGGRGRGPVVRRRLTVRRSTPSTIGTAGGSEMAAVTASVDGGGPVADPNGVAQSALEVSSGRSESPPVTGGFEAPPVDWPSSTLAHSHRVSKRLKLSELLHFRRRGFGNGAVGRGSSKSPQGSPKYSSRRFRHQNHLGDRYPRSPPTLERRSESASSASPLSSGDGGVGHASAGLPTSEECGNSACVKPDDLVACRESLEEDTAAAAAAGAAVSAPEGREGDEPDRRLSLKMTSSVSATSKRRSLLEAGKMNLRRGKHTLSRGISRLKRDTTTRTTLPQEHSPYEEPEEGGLRGEEDERPSAKNKQGEQTKAPRLGSTYVGRSSSAPLDDDAAAPWNTWSNGKASDFKVRTKGYGNRKTKAPSAPALYELVSLDAYRSPAGRLCEIYPLFSPPVSLSSAVESMPGNREASAGSGDRVGASDAGSAGHSDTVPRRRPHRSLSDDGQYGRQLDEDGGRDGNNGDRSRGSHRPRWIGGEQRAKGCKSAGDTGNPRGKVDESLRGGEGVAREPASVKCADQVPESTGHPDIPPVFVVNGQLPDVAPPLSAQGNGPTIHVVLVFRATPQLCRYAAKLWASDPRSKATGTSNDGPGHDSACDGRGVVEGSMRRSTSEGGKVADGEGEGETAVPESVPLLAEWMRRAADDGNFRGRFKAIGDVVNMDEVGLPGFSRRFSGKPILVYGRECSMKRGDGFAELDLNAHSFSFIGRKGLHMTLDRWKKAMFRIGFLIEGRSNEEQPEQILGCAVLKGLDLSMTQELSLSPDGKRLVVGKPEEAASAADGACAAHKQSLIKRASKMAERVQKSSSRRSYSRLPLVPRRHLEILRGGDGSVGSEASPNLTGEGRGGLLVEWLLVIVSAAWFPALLTLATVAWWTGIWG